MLNKKLKNLTYLPSHNQCAHSHDYPKYPLQGRYKGRCPRGRWGRCHRSHGCRVAHRDVNCIDFLHNLHLNVLHPVANTRSGSIGNGAHLHGIARLIQLHRHRSNLLQRIPEFQLYAIPCLLLSCILDLETQDLLTRRLLRAGAARQAQGTHAYKHSR